MKLFLDVISPGQALLREAPKLLPVILVVVAVVIVAAIIVRRRKKK